MTDPTTDVSSPAEQPVPMHWYGPPPPQKSKLGRRLLLALLFFGVPLLLFVFMLSALGSLFSTGSSDSLKERTYNDRLWDGKSGDKVAIIRLEGTIIGGGGYIKKQIEKVTRDKNVKAVVLRVNSPGGMVAGADAIYDQLRKMRKSRGSEGAKLPMVVSMGAIAASGGYYAAMAVEDTPDSIYAEPTTWTGSIGVIIPHYDLSGLMDEYKIEEDSIKSHPLKGMGGLTRKMKPEEREIFQQLVDESFGSFKEIVARGRPGMTQEKIAEVATGQVFTTRQALEHGLVDKRGYLEDAIRAAIAMAGLTESEVRVVEYKRQPSLMDVLVAKAEQPKTELQAIMDMATPRAFYLYTWMPGALSSWRTAE